MFQNSITTRAARDTNKCFSRHLHFALHSTSLFSLIVLFCPTLESSVPTFFAYGWLFSPYLHVLCTLLLKPWERMVVFSFIWVDGVCWRKPTIVVVWTELLARDMISWAPRSSVVRLDLILVYKARPPIIISLGISFIPQWDPTNLSAYTRHQPLKGRMESL